MCIHEYTMKPEEGGGDSDAGVVRGCASSTWVWELNWCPL